MFPLVSAALHISDPGMVHWGADQRKLGVLDGDTSLQHRVRVPRAGNARLYVWCAVVRAAAGGPWAAMDSAIFRSTSCAGSDIFRSIPLWITREYHHRQGFRRASADGTSATERYPSIT